MNNTKRTSVSPLRVLQISVILSASMSASVVEAGSIFMKNGYIIQGTIVDRDDDKLVLGWHNGKVQIARRFVESVIFDPIEEQQLRELAITRDEIASRGPEEDLAFLESSSSNEDFDLPPTLEVFMRTRNIGPVDSGPVEFTPPPEIDSIVETEGSDGGGDVLALEPVEPVEPVELPPVETTTVEVTQLTPDDEPLDEEFHDARRSLALRPPRNWVPMVQEDALQIRGARGASGFQPSLNVVVFEAGALGPSEYAALLKDEQVRLLEDYELIEERSRSVGGVPALQLVARGSRDGQQALLLQAVAVRDGKAWLFSGFSAIDDGDADVALIEQALDSVEFDEE